MKEIIFFAYIDATFFCIVGNNLKYLKAVFSVSKWAWESEEGFMRWQNIFCFGRRNSLTKYRLCLQSEGVLKNGRKRLEWSIALIRFNYRNWYLRILLCWLNFWKPVMQISKMFFDFSNTFLNYFAGQIPCWSEKHNVIWEINECYGMKFGIIQLSTVWKYPIFNRNNCVQTNFNHFSFKRYR